MLSDHGLRDPRGTGALIARARERCRCELDAIDHFEKGLRCGFDDVCRHARAAISALIVLHVYEGFALGVFARGYAAYLELTQYDIHAGRAFDRLERGVHGTVARRAFLDFPAIGVLEPHRGLGGP